MGVLAGIASALAGPGHRERAALGAAQLDGGARVHRALAQLDGAGRDALLEGHGELVAAAALDALDVDGRDGGLVADRRLALVVDVHDLGLGGGGGHQHRRAGQGRGGRERGGSLLVRSGIDTSASPTFLTAHQIGRSRYAWGLGEGRQRARRISTCSATSSRPGGERCGTRQPAPRRPSPDPTAGAPELRPYRLARPPGSPHDPPVQAQPLDDEHPVAAGPPGAVRGARRGLPGAPVGRPRARSTLLSQPIRSSSGPSACRQALVTSSETTSSTSSAAARWSAVAAGSQPQSYSAWRVKSRASGTTPLAPVEAEPTDLRTRPAGRAARSIAGSAGAARLRAAVARRVRPGGAHQRFTSPIHQFTIQDS